MTLRLHLIVLALSAALGAPALAQQASLTMMTGGPSGTYIQIGRDIAAAAGACGLEVEVVESAGSLENAQAVRDRPRTQLGIVQSDVLEYLTTFAAEDPALRRVAEGLRIAFPLYNEEIHVLARREISDLDGLAGKRVAVGAANSGNALTAQLLFDLVEVEPGTRVTDLAPDAALPALIDGSIDAMIYVVGAPAALFADPRLDAARFHLLPLTDPVLAAVYSPTEIAAGTYPFVTEATPVVAVKALLMAYNFVPERNSYQRESCEAIADLAHVVTTRFATLKADGHPKWAAVDMTELPPGWQVSDCVLAGLAPERPFTCVAPDGTRTEEGGAATPADPNALYLRRVCDRIGC